MTQNKLGSAADEPIAKKAHIQVQSDAESHTSLGFRYMLRA